MMEVIGSLAANRKADDVYEQRQCDVRILFGCLQDRSNMYTSKQDLSQTSVKVQRAVGASM